MEKDVLANSQIQGVDSSAPEDGIASSMTQPVQSDNNTVSNASNSKDKDFVSTGYKIHKQITYRGVDWIINSAFAIGFAFLASQTKIGQDYFTKPITGFFEKALKPFFKSSENLQKGANWGTSFIGIMFGGTAIIPAMTALESKKNKKSIVRWLDEKIYGKDVVDSDPKFAESYQRIDDEPKKKFSTGMVARFAALTPLILLTVSPWNDTIKTKFYDKIANVTKFIGNKLGLKKASLNELATSTVTNADGSPETKWDYIHRIIAFDISLTFFYSFLHEAAYKALAAVGIKKHEGQNPDETKLATQTKSNVDTARNVVSDLDSHDNKLPEKKYSENVARAKNISPKSLTERSIRSDQEAVLGV